MKAIGRTFASVAASALVSLALAGAVLAAEPPTVGGTLSAAGDTIYVMSGGNVPASVVLTATDVTLSVDEFIIQPGETQEVTFSGAKAIGTVTAVYSILPMEGQEAGSATLTLALEPMQTPAPSPLPAILFGLLLLAGFAFLMRRLRPWRWRIQFAPPSPPPAA